MKILDWMHQKLRKGGTVPFKYNNSITGPIGSCYTGSISKHNDPKNVTYKTQHKSNWRETSNAVEVWNGQHGIQEESLVQSPDIYNGFLSIGFLGLEPIISEPVTPTFNNLLTDDGQLSVTEENELRFINEELEKFIEDEADEENMTVLSSGRNSQASVITLANMHIKGDGLEQEHLTLCPLQDYLFGSTTEILHSGGEVKKKMSLRELFYENELSQKYPQNERKRKDINTKQHKKFTLLSMKKLLKKLKYPQPLEPPASGKFTATGKKNKVTKFLKMLSRKVHPEKSNETDNIVQSGLDVKFHKATNDATDTGERHYLTITELKCGSQAEYKEQWIKTDTDYLVLEL